MSHTNSVIQNSLISKILQNYIDLFRLLSLIIRQLCNSARTLLISFHNYLCGNAKCARAERLHNKYALPKRQKICCKNDFKKVFTVYYTTFFILFIKIEIKISVQLHKNIFRDSKKSAVLETSPDESNNAQKSGKDESKRRTIWFTYQKKTHGKSPRILAKRFRNDKVM